VTRPIAGRKQPPETALPLISVRDAFYLFLGWTRSRSGEFVDEAGIQVLLATRYTMNVCTAYTCTLGPSASILTSTCLTFSSTMVV
jgi:hypothetical protein